MLSESEMQESIAGHIARNTELLQSLHARLSIHESRVIEYHFWAPDRQAAANLAREMYMKGFLVTAIAPLQLETGGLIWNVEVEAYQSPNTASSPEVTEELVRIAGAYGVTYDGWGTNL